MPTTVPDADLVLGRLNPDYFLGGKLPLYRELARKAIQVGVADKTGRSWQEAALGMIRIVNANMAKGISGNSVEKGYDLREFALVAMGGAAALHAAALARELNMAKVIAPAMCGNFSAVGLAVADIQHDYVRTFARKETHLDPVEPLRVFQEMREEAGRQLLEERVPKERIEISWSADLRYEGQSWELNIPVQRREHRGSGGFEKHCRHLSSASSAGLFFFRTQRRRGVCESEGSGNGRDSRPHLAHAGRTGHAGRSTGQRKKESVF